MYSNEMRSLYSFCLIFFIFQFLLYFYIYIFLINLPSEKTKFDVSFYNFVNEQIDVYGDRTPPLRAFILPGGGELSSTLQYARAVCRRVERTIVPLLKAEAIDGDCLRFVNRLSDLLFILARYIASISGRKEAVYHRFQSDPESKITQIP
ncbi:unnamed protein product [Dracunculus medinensis]|uniref:Corrinoid adenosyltransferase n=1 Tax=Dracunculus medinensis TaxID=318479 RepID=A0A158Q2P0_DRAME|nr:unnamed protein product [Dracunculus medinensis]